MPIYYAGKVTKQEYLKSFILHSSRIRQRKWFFGFAILVIIVGAIVMHNQNPRMLTDYAPSLLFGLLFLSYPWWTPYLSLLSYGQKGNFFHSNLHGAISDNTITINGEKLQIELQWTAFIDYKIDKDLVLLYQSPNQFNIFVRSMFSNQDEWEMFASVAREKIALNKK
jgi:hypothetical protein